MADYEFDLSQLPALPGMSPAAGTPQQDTDTAAPAAPTPAADAPAAPQYDFDLSQLPQLPGMQAPPAQDAAPAAQPEQSDWWSQYWGPLKDNASRAYHNGDAMPATDPGTAQGLVQARAPYIDAIAAGSTADADADAKARAAESADRLAKIDHVLGVMGGGDNFIGQGPSSPADTLSQTPHARLMASDRYRQVYDSAVPVLGEQAAQDYARQTIAKQAHDVPYLRDSILADVMGLPKGTALREQYGAPIGDAPPDFGDAQVTPQEMQHAGDAFGAKGEQIASDLRGAGLTAAQYLALANEGAERVGMGPGGLPIPGLGLLRGDSNFNAIDALAAYEKEHRVEGGSKLQRAATGFVGGLGTGIVGGDGGAIEDIRQGKSIGEAERDLALSTIRNEAMLAAGYIGGPFATRLAVQGGTNVALGAGERAIKGEDIADPYAIGSDIAGAVIGAHGEAPGEAPKPHEESLGRSIDADLSGSATGSTPGVHKLIDKYADAVDAAGDDPAQHARIAYTISQVQSGEKNPMWGVAELGNIAKHGTTRDEAAFQQWHDQQAAAQATQTPAAETATPEAAATTQAAQELVGEPSAPASTSAHQLADADSHLTPLTTPRITADDAKAQALHETMAAKVDRGELTQDQADAVMAHMEPARRDALTGFLAQEHHDDSIRRAQDWVDATDQPAQYMTFDLRNIGGMNGEFGHTATNDHIRALSNIIHEEVPGSHAELSRNGSGDEIAGPVYGITPEQAAAIRDRVATRGKQYSAENGLDSIKNPKYDAQYGTGIEGHHSEIVPGVPVHEIAKLADTALERRKSDGPSTRSATRDHGNEAGVAGLAQDAESAGGRGEGGLRSGQESAQAEGIPSEAGGTDHAAVESERAGTDRPVQQQDGNVAPGSLDAAAHEAATSPLNDKPEPTPAQASAGNYAKGHVRLQGLDVSIENPRGSTRSGTDENGQPWTREMRHHYGYIKGTLGADGQHMDVMLGENPGNPMRPVFVINQRNAAGGFDEHKVMLGFKNQRDAERAYRSEYPRGWDRMGEVRQMSSPDFKQWLRTGAREEAHAGPVDASVPRVMLRNQQADAVAMHGVTSAPNVARVGPDGAPLPELPNTNRNIRKRTYFDDARTGATGAHESVLTNLYDLDKDPRGLVDAARAQLHQRGLPDDMSHMHAEFERQVVQHGFDGYRGGGKGVVLGDGVTTRETGNANDGRASAELGNGRKPHASENAGAVDDPGAARETQPRAGGADVHDIPTENINGGARVSGSDGTPRAPAHPEPVSRTASNADTEAMRAEAGEPAAEPREVKPDEKLKADAKAVLAENRDAGDQLAQSLLKNPRAASDTETAVLTMDRARLNTERAASLDRAAKSIDAGDNEAAAAHAAAAEATLDKLRTNWEATTKSGTEWGRGGRARQLAPDDQFSLARMLTERKVAKGAKLTAAEESETRALHERIAALESQMRDRQQRNGRRPVSKDAAGQARSDFDKAVEKFKSISKIEQMTKECAL